MSPDSPLVTSVVVTVLLAAAFTPGVAALQQADATIAVDGSQPIPEQVLTFDNDEFRVDSVYVGDPGDSLAASVDVTDSDVYRVYMYDTDGQVVTQQRRTDDATVTFDLESYPAGTYLLAVNQDGRFLAVHPVLVRGYEVDLTAPDSVARDEQLDVQASLTYLRGERVEELEFVVTDGDQRVRAPGQRTEANSYEARIDVSELEAGSYDVFATVRGSETAYGEAEFLGVNAGASLEITTSAPDGTATQTSNPSSGGGGDTGDAATATATATPTPDDGTSTGTPGSPTASPTEATGMPTATERPTTTAPTASPTEATETPTVTEQPTTTVPTASSTEPDDGVVTPRPTTSPSPTTARTPGDGPGFGLVVALVALVLAAAVATRR